MTKHERSIKLVDIALDQYGMMLLHTRETEKRKPILFDIEKQLAKRNQLVAMELTEINAYNEGLT